MFLYTVPNRYSQSYVPSFWEQKWHSSNQNLKCYSSRVSNYLKHLLQNRFFFLLLNLHLCLPKLFHPLQFFLDIINSFRLSRIRPQCFHNISISHKSKLILNYSWAYRNAQYCKDLKQFPWIQSDHPWKWTNFPYEIWLSYFETVKVR